ncbi:MAG: hypothetical protein OSB19_03570 [Opitutaceae bacterium]|nr:hypothetical protein [Opitutaceae bacterium]
MENGKPKRKEERLKAAFPEAMEYVDTRVLDIEDSFRFMDPELKDYYRLDPLEWHAIGKKK